ncbi:MAG TPA: NAD+ synthase [Exilispira sp.]|nr:NAD+ synthase [Exilispira sp.]HNV43496.1 NAD+ synthase [Exilispira sp.]HPO60243.1 NAD+ synthase [Exilispira sp.]
MVKFIDSKIIHEHLLDFIKNYLKESKFDKGFVALSGGLDSACIASLLVDSIGSENVIAAFFPSKITSPESEKLYFKLIDQLNIKNHLEISIEPLISNFASIDKTLLVDNEKNNLRLGNIMARVRMILSYDIAAKYNALVIGTENKTEFLLGYSTQWGDSAAAIHPMGDIYKTEVFSLASFMGLPEETIKRIPTAELWHNQEDEKEIGVSYKNADAILYLHFEKNYNENQIISEGFGEKDVMRVFSLVKRSCFKRRLPLCCSMSDCRKN